MPPPEEGRAAHARSGAAPRLIQRYEAIAQASRRMLSAARSEDWDEVARLEGRCRDLIAELKTAQRSERLSAPEQRRRIELLRAMLADDAEIRARAEPWLRQLERLIHVRRGARRARS